LLRLVAREHHDPCRLTQLAAQETTYEDAAERPCPAGYDDCFPFEDQRWASAQIAS
jgi:hypothetical protein